MTQKANPTMEYTPKLNSTMEYTPGEVVEINDGTTAHNTTFILPLPIGSTYAVYTMPRADFAHTTLTTSQIYVDSETMLVYIGDDFTKGGVLAQNYENFNGIDGIQGHNPNYITGFEGI
jgi:hypothetical protein